MLRRRSDPAGQRYWEREEMDATLRQRGIFIVCISTDTDRLDNDYDGQQPEYDNYRWNSTEVVL